MARYFRYKSPEEVVADAESLGESLAMSADLSPLFQPLMIGPLKVGGRLAIHPMEGCDGTLDGNPDELTYRRYQRFGAGGAKLVWGEAAAVCPEGRANTRQLQVAEHTVKGLERMLTLCRTSHAETMGSADGLVVGLQLTHSGRYSVPKPWLATHDPILDPLTKDRTTGRTVDASTPLLSDDDLKRVEDHYVRAAKWCAKLGYDFVDIKQCHRYLLSELLSARNRQGLYGGSLENRTRLVRNVVQRIRQECPGLVIATRMNAYDGIPYRKAETGDEPIGVPCPHDVPLVTAWGTNLNDHLQYDLTEPLQHARNLRDWGVQMISISLGNPYSNPHLVRPAEYPPVDGYFSPEHPLHGVCRHFRIAEAIQAAVPDVPVVGSGYSWLQDFAAQAAAANVGAGHVAMAGFGRATLSHPEFARVLETEGKFRRKQICRTFSYCTALMRAKDHPLGQYPTGCPPFDKDIYGPLWKEIDPAAKKS